MTKTQVMNKTAVLAYSGGLDTSYCVKYLSEEKGLDVHTIVVHTGGFSEDQLKAIEQRAYQLGATRHETIDALPDYYAQCIKYLIFGNVLKNNTYPLSVSAERFFQAMAVAQYAHNIKADYVAHGSTGAGNDQVRFDVAFQILAPQTEILTPIRDQGLSRQQEVEYLQQHGVDISWKDAVYSINKGVWGTSVGGAETLTSHQSLPGKAYPAQLKKEAPETITLHFTKGELTGLDDVEMEPLEAIEKLSTLANAFAIGRDVHVGDTIIGIKGRVGFEAAAPLIIIKAHHLLEKHVQSKDQQQLKSFLAETYGNKLHEAQFLDPVMRNIEAFFESTQQRVSGKVTVKLMPYRFELIGIESPYDLLASKAGIYGESNNAWTSEEAKGFIKLYGMAQKIYHSYEND